MDKLTQNTKDCKQFVQNPFKKESCKNCQKSWREHRGVIDQKYVDEFVAKEQKVLADQRAKEEEAKAKEKAKALAKKKATQDKTDNWYGVSDHVDDAMNLGGKSDSDDDMGFRMFTPGPELLKAPEQRASSCKPLKVVNLIDFGACAQENEELPSGTVGGASEPLTAVIPSTPSAASNAPGAIPLAKRESMASCAASAPVNDTDSIQEKLNEEIQLLQQMLSDANEEKNIHLAIVQDEVNEMQHELEKSNKKRAEVEAQLSEMRQKLYETEVERDEARKQIEHTLNEANHQRAESQRLRSESQELCSEVERLRSASMQPSDSAVAAMTELRTLLARAREVSHGEQINHQEQQQPHEPVHANGVSGHDLETDLQILCNAARSVLEAADRSSAERAQLITSVQRLEAEVTRREAPPAPVLQVMPNTLTPSPMAAEEAKIRFAEQTLKEIRINAEQQLAWLHKRMRITPS